MSFEPHPGTQRESEEFDAFLSDSVKQNYTEGQILMGLSLNIPTLEEKRIRLHFAEMADVLLSMRKEHNSYLKNVLIGATLQSLISTQMLMVKTLNFKL